MISRKWIPSFNPDDNTSQNAMIGRRVHTISHPDLHEAYVGLDGVIFEHRSEVTTRLYPFSEELKKVEETWLVRFKAGHALRVSRKMFKMIPGTAEDMKNRKIIQTVTTIHREPA